jgi:hypothetical protein
MKWKLKEKLKSYYSNNSRPVKGICKNSLTPSKDQTLRLMSIEGQEVQAKENYNICKNIITENFPNLEKTMLI